MKLYVFSVLSILLSGIAYSNKIPNYAIANLVLGQSNFTTGTGASVASSFSIGSATSVVVDPVTRKVFVSDYLNKRVLRYASATALTNGAGAEAVFGQPRFSTSNASSGDQRIAGPIGLCFDRRGRLWVACYEDHRVLMFEAASYRETFPFADKVLGQSDYTTFASGTTASAMNGPTGVFVDADDRLWVADYGNHRVLRFNSVTSKSSGGFADGVLGQNTFLTDTNGILPSQLRSPIGITVSSGGELFVACAGSNRVVRFDNAAGLTDGASAAAILGQPDFTQSTSGITATKLHTPYGLCITSTDTLWVNDYSNNRCVRFANASTASSGAAAAGVIGQPNLTTNIAVAATGRSLNSPYSNPFVDTTGSLWIADLANRRVLRFPADTTLPLVAVTSSVPKTTTKAKFVIRGTASDAYGVARVQYRVGSGPVKTATGTTTWQFRASLAMGRNTITIQSVDSVGNVSSTKTIRIRRN